MYLLYLDESGQYHGRQTDYFVMGGLAVHEEDCYPFGRSIESLMRRALPSAHTELELHASRVWAARSGRFDSDAGVQHGMAHLVRGYRSCFCVACASRRNRVIEITVPAEITALVGPGK